MVEGHAEQFMPVLTMVLDCGDGNPQFAAMSTWVHDEQIIHEEEKQTVAKSQLTQSAPQPLGRGTPEVIGEIQMVSMQAGVHAVPPREQ